MSSDRRTALDARPSVSRPDALGPAALADARRHQPLRGLIGLAFVVPVTALLSIDALGPIIAFALPIVAMIAFWWEDWPGTLFPRAWSGLYDTAIVVVGGLLLALLGHFALSLAGGIFTIMLQLTLVCERWPLTGIGRVPAGFAAVALCWALGLITWSALVRSHAMPAANYGAWCTSIGAWQMIWYVALRGWPFARIDRKWLRLLLANVVVIGSGWAGYLLLDDILGWPGNRTIAVAGTGIGCTLLVSMLFEAWPAIRLAGRPAPGRTIAVSVAVILTVVLVRLAPTLGPPLSTAVILHVAVWRRWPVRPAATTMSA